MLQHKPSERYGLMVITTDARHTVIVLRQLIPFNFTVLFYCTGFQFNVGWISRWPPWSTCHCLSGMASAYLVADCQLVSDEGRRQLRSATSRTCVVRRTYSNYGDRCFAAAGLKLWNSLPADLQQADISFQQFKRLLKTFLFGC